MAVVLTSEESDPFASSTLRRSHSQSKFLSSHRSQAFHTSASTSRIDQLFRDNYRHQPIPIAPESSPSSGPPSPSSSTLHAESECDPSYLSTPATSVSLDGQFEDDVSGHSQDSLLLSEHADNPYFMLDGLDDLEPSLSLDIGDSHIISPADESAGTSRPESPVAPEHAEDDTAVARHPTQHVDYLSHDWREEDIWSSWRYIISKRTEFANAARLENASWRTWMKAKYGLKTVSPETLNWLKDCDVTWLYGPLQTHQYTLFADSPERSGSTLSRSDSFIHKKPILKKRSMSEVMLQRSLSSSSLLKQAAAAVQAQQKEGTSRIGRPILHRAHTDLVTFPFSKRRRSRANTSLLPSNATSGLASPATERKHIHFDEQVKQCIAVEVKGDDDDDEPDSYHWGYDDSDSDDSAIMMKVTKTRKKPIYLRRKPIPSSSNESKTIAMLPSTTLKYREDSPAPPDTAAKHSTSIIKSPTLSPSPSQETLRPSKPSGSFFQHNDEEGIHHFFEDNESGPNFSSTKESLRLLGPHQSVSTGSSREGEQPAGMRRTESGMFMPYEEGEGQPNDGIIGRVIDTVNTARDIAHVIWNVGWRR
ncbi:hypothetical protein F4678DRAFT_458237 [Xylaria arbuscula]|nr:hypothetical protein F4678DRAFT_458237 [Xylaria arbuscula]